MTLLIVAAVLAVLLLTYISMRNGLVAANQSANSGWSAIEVQLKRRHDLVPNLVKAAAGAQKYEKGIIDSILATREKAIAALSSGDSAKISNAEAALSQGLRSFMAYTESNPQITATSNIGILQHQLEDTEDQIAAARRFYNASIEAYNTKVESMPWNFIAGQMGLKTRSMFELSASERAAANAVPEVNL